MALRTGRNTFFTTVDTTTTWLGTTANPVDVTVRQTSRDKTALRSDIAGISHPINLQTVGRSVPTLNLRYLIG